MALLLCKIGIQIENWEHIIYGTSFGWFDVQISILIENLPHFSSALLIHLVSTTIDS